MRNANRKILVLGATGYVGRHLVPALLKTGYDVTVSGRSLNKLNERFSHFHPEIKAVPADVTDAATLEKAFDGIDDCFYLVHSMNRQTRNFAETDRLAARNVARVAAQKGVRRIIYLGGLGEENDQLSKHLKSRQEVAGILREGRVPVTVLRAAMIIGSGSASFEILRYLTERLPVMITPRWVMTPSQPIALENVTGYLCGCLEKDQTIGETFDIGGKEIVSYGDLIKIYADVSGLGKRIIIPVPVLTPWLSSLWIHLVTPIPSYIAIPLTEGLKNPVICRDMRISSIIPQKLLSCREAIRDALSKGPVQKKQICLKTPGKEALL